MNQLVYRHEPKLFFISFVLSLVFWIAIIAGTFGIALLYLLIAFLAYLFIHSGFISHLKGNGVRVTESQYPELWQRYIECCNKLEINKRPDLYLINSDGILNALATHFLRRHYVVLYSQIVDALSRHPKSLDFYIGHELGHIKRGHLKWSSFLLPSSILPVLGTAYARSNEYSCDLHGLACCESNADAALGMAVLAAGNGQWSKLNLKEYMNQSAQTGSFWMSFHELTSDYPWLCKRMTHIAASKDSTAHRFPRRSFWAWLLSLFVPRVGYAGGGVSVLVGVALIGILAAVAIPAYQDYVVRAKATAATQFGQQIISNASAYIQTNRSLPDTLAEIGLNEEPSSASIRRVDIIRNGFELELQGHSLLDGKTIIYQPYFDDSEKLRWYCGEGTLEQKFRPAECRK